MDEEVLSCGGALLVTMSVISLEFKAHLTSMATTAFCSGGVSKLSTGTVYILCVFTFVMCALSGGSVYVSVFVSLTLH